MTVMCIPVGPPGCGKSTHALNMVEAERIVELTKIRDHPTGLIEVRI